MVGDQRGHPAAIEVTEALVKVTIESWRFCRLFGRLLERIDVTEQQRYNNQFSYYRKSLEETLASVGLQLVNLEGQPYDAGFAAQAINAGDFGADDELVVEQMLEPIVMGPDGLVKSGVVVLGKMVK